MATQIAFTIPSSPSYSSWKYDVFLSFCGDDTRKNFRDHLYTALKQKGIITFMDDEKLERGKYISQELLKAIEESKYAIVVLSKNYASSRWYLIELAKIVECMTKTGLTILPVFYHVDPSDVRNQMEILAEAFAKHEKDPKINIEDVQAWKTALKEVGNISGWHVNDRMNELFTLHVHHGGHFMWNPQAYVGGTIDIVDNCDPDRWSKVEIESICRDFGYSEVDKLWYKMPGVDPERSNFHQVVDDDAAMFMTDLVKGYGEIHVFVEHPVHEPVELPVEDFDPLAAALPGSEVEGVGVEVFASDRVLQNDNEEYRPDFSQFGGHDDAEFVNEEVCARRAGKAPVVDDQVEESSEGSDGAYLGSEGSEGSEDERSDLEEEAEAEAEPEPEVQPMNIGEDSPNSWDNQAENAEVEAGQMGGGVMNSDYESEELLSLDESSSGNEGGDDSSDDDIPVAEVDNSIRSSKYPIFRPVAKAENLRFEKDMLFISAKQFKDALTDYAVHGGWGIKFVKNDLVRVRARCQPGCNFVAYLAKVPREKSFRLKTLNMEHTCSRSYRNPRCTASYIGKKLVKRVRRQPGIKLKDIQEAVHEKYVVDISAGKASRARERAQDAVDGTHTAQFNQLWEYCDELRRCSPGSTILMKVHTYEDGDLAAEHGLATGLPYFERMYICLEGCKKGFLAGCRPIIGLDACHLKTKTGGQLMCAVGRDPNDEYFPFAYAVVEAETKDSWTWFLNLLLADIGDDKQWVFISDQQKGLVNTFVDNWPQYEHRICCRHLYQNLRKNHPGVIIRDLFWKAAKATYRQAFERAMNELKEVDEDAFKWLQSQSTTIWARHMFKSDGQSDTVLNNMCESFNSTIVKFRSKPIITMLECIRLYLMTRFQANREMIMKVESELCPKIRKRLYKEKLACSKWIACWAGRMKFEVKNGLESFIVDLEEKKCSCRRWDIVGIPCCHAISCIFFNREDAEKYVNACYKRTTYIDCYEPIIEPINGQNMWGPTGLPPVQPPIKRRPPGRPKKKRALEPDEPRSHRKKRGLGISKQCKLCGKLGHNKRSCKGEVGGNSSLPGSASQASGTTRRAAKDAQPTVHRAQPSSNDDVTTSAPPTPTDNQSNRRPKKQRKRSAVTTETLNATGNAARYMAAMRSAKR